MKLVDHPDLADRLAAAYALGTLRGGARRRFETQARQSPALRAAALAWQERFAGMTEFQRAQAPSANVWKRIQNIVAAEPGPRGPSAGNANRGRLSAPAWWRGAALACGIAAIAAIGAGLYLNEEVAAGRAQIAQLVRARATLAQDKAQLAAQLQAAPEIRYVAVLSGEDSAASMLVTFDPKHNTLTLKRVGPFQEGPDKSLQLWALPASGAPRSLGVLGSEPVVKLTAAESQVGAAPALAISLEPKGGVPGESGPTGPVLFKGPVLPAT